MHADTIKGLGVVSIESGAKLGSVDDLLFDSRGLRLAALHISADGQQGVIPYEQVRAIGENAVTISADSAVLWASSGSELASLPTLAAFKKLKVVDEAGTLLGTVQHVEVRPEDGRISELTVHKGGILGLGGETTIIPAGEITSVGDEVIVVPARQTANEV
jgi:sporulation protein YlmC with PRC-barrel domain